MDTLPITGNLTMLRVNGWQVYLWRDGDSVTLIDTGAPGSGNQILSAVPGIDRIVLTHGHVDHTGSAAAASRVDGCARAGRCRGRGRHPRRGRDGPGVCSRTPKGRSARVPVTASGRWPTSCHTDAVAAEPGIEPDTLKRTWVLTRPCPECGLDPAVVHHACDVGHRVHHAYNVGHR
jgi:hypothetical protein